MNSSPEFPFTAVTGQANYKLALKLLVVDPAIGGLLVSGPRGTAKSTLARGLSDIAPGLGPFVNLPLGASEEMLVGSLDLQKAMGEQEVSFNPGLLARADRGVLYVDEINLLPDNLVDLLLDVAASGVNHIERDGISHQHKSRFILLGTMNPDEGELRPQLQDRFGLAVEMQQQFSAPERVEIVRQREQFDHHPEAFYEQQQSQQSDLRERLKQARQRLDQIEFEDALRLDIAERCIAAGVDGLRADIVWAKSALAHAALMDKSEVDSDDIEAVAELVLSHRRKPDDSAASQPPSSQARGQAPQSPQADGAGDWGQMSPVRQPTSRVSRFIAAQATPIEPLSAGAANHKLATPKGGARGLGPRKTKFDSHRLDWFRTLAANLGQWPLAKWRFRRQRGGDPVLHLVMLDTSASTLRNNRFGDARAAILNIAEQAYLQRQQLSILGFGNQRVQTLLPRKRAPKALRALLDGIEAGGGTPLRQVLEQAIRFQLQMRRSQPDLRLCNYLITDGRSSASLEGLTLSGDTILIDIESSRVRRGRGAEFARCLGASYQLLPV